MHLIQIINTVKLNKVGFNLRKLIVIIRLIYYIKLELIHLIVNLLKH
jgi:hypothetical protein